MLNIEKYKDEILNAAQADITCCVIDLFHNGVCPDDCKDCKKAAMEWLLEECKEPILTDSEREYLSAVIKPYKNKVTFIAKSKDAYEAKYFISIVVNGNYGREAIHLPWFKENTMYKGMEIGKHYTLKELGL